MITHYKKTHDAVENKLLEGKNSGDFNAQALAIINTLDTYAGRHRTGDKYAHMLFKCSLLYYVDKFGEADLSKAVEKIFIWAYTPRLTYQNLQLASIDNYVLSQFNLFKKINEAVYKEEIINLELPLIEPREEHKSAKTSALRKLFVNMKYYANAN
ncbi:MAG: hypothetical protein EOP48_26965 [Sphingobacteriales bacterium]|nr:MAG: hypothetical protein EOP48_26965 [Sphingobacteriales bacterium]